MTAFCTCTQKDAEVTVNWEAMPLVRDLGNLGDARRGMQTAISQRRAEVFACFAGSVAPNGFTYIGETVGLNLVGDDDSFVLANAWIVDRNVQVAEIETCLVKVLRGARFQVPGVKKGTRLRTTNPIVHNFPKT